MYFSSDLKQYIQNQYVAYKYTEGIYVFSALEDDVVETVIESFIRWADEKGLIKDDMLDVSVFYRKED